MEQTADNAPMFMAEAWTHFKKIDPVKRALYGIKNRGQFQKIGAHEVMLADRRRVELYRQAIEARITPDQTVVDLGTGTASWRSWRRSGSMPSSTAG